MIYFLSHLFSLISLAIPPECNDYIMNAKIDIDYNIISVLYLFPISKNVNILFCKSIKYFTLHFYILVYYRQGCENKGNFT